MSRYYIIEISGDNDELHRAELAQLVLRITRTTVAAVERAWVQSGDPTTDQSLVGLAVEDIEERLIRLRQLEAESMATMARQLGVFEEDLKDDVSS